MVRKIPTNSMRRTALSIATILLLCWPLGALAAPPASVTGVAATFVNGIVLVTWNTPLNNSDIAKYRVYYSHQSILGNGGTYDDFATTTSTAPSFSLSYTGTAHRLYVSVVAVSSTGEESTTFGSEAFVDISSGPASASSASQNSMLRLLAAKSLSPSSLELDFTEPVSLLRQDPFSCFTIVDEAGHSLAVLGMHVSGSSVIVTTPSQKVGEQYTVTVSNIWAVSSNEVIKPTNATAIVSSGNETAPSPAPTSSPSSTSAPIHTPSTSATDVTHLSLKSAQGDDGLYTITVSFDVPGDASPDTFDISQTTDGGLTYSDPQSIAGSTRQLRINNVPPGTFGILIRSRPADGEETSGTVGSIDLAVAANQRLLPSEHNHHGLTQSGAGFMFVLCLTGAFMGWLRLRKKPLVVA